MKMKFKKIPLNLKNKVVFLRADLNSDVKNKKVLMSQRIKESSKTIILLKKRKARVVVIAHQGRLGKKDYTSLKQHAKFLNKFTKIKFVEDIIGKKAEREIKKLKPGKALLLENIRSLKEETDPGDLEKNNFIQKISKWGDIYVNDAFSVSHRKHSSIIGLPKFMDSFAGPLIIKEIEALEKIKIKNCIYILGGAKPEDNIKLLGKNKTISGGLFGQLCLISLGKNLGAQDSYLKKTISNYSNAVINLKKKLKEKEIKGNLKTPVDFAVKIKGKRKEILLEDFPNKYEIFDIGKKTQELFSKEIRKAKAVYMKGPLGDAGDKRFCKGTIFILKTISESKCFSLIGGGHLSDAIEKSKIPKRKFDHISLSGGALLRYIAGEKLPGLEYLK